jgi:hypothetical protein
MDSYRCGTSVTSPFAPTSIQPCIEIIMITPWNTVLLGQLIVAQLSKEFPAFYGTRMFITVFIRARQWSLSWARWIQFTPSRRKDNRSVINCTSLFMYFNPITKEQICRLSLVDLIRLQRNVSKCVWVLVMRLTCGLYCTCGGGGVMHYSAIPCNAAAISNNSSWYLVCEIWCAYSLISRQAVPGLYLRTTNMHFICKRRVSSGRKQNCGPDVGRGRKSLTTEILIMRWMGQVLFRTVTAAPLNDSSLVVCVCTVSPFTLFSMPVGSILRNHVFILLVSAR